MRYHMVRRFSTPGASGLALIFLLAVLQTSCLRFPVQLSDSTSHLEGVTSYEILGDAEGEACQFNLFFLIPFGGNQLWKAKERAIGEADGLVDISVDSSVGFAVIGTVACTLVKGKRYRLRSEPAPYQAPEPIREVGEGAGSADSASGSSEESMVRPQG